MVIPSMSSTGSGPAAWLTGSIDMNSRGPGLIEQTERRLRNGGTLSAFGSVNMYGMDGNQTAAGAMVQGGYMIQAMSVNAGAAIVLSPAVPICSLPVNIAVGATVSGGANIFQQDRLVRAGVQENYDPMQFLQSTFFGALDKAMQTNCFRAGTPIIYNHERQAKPIEQFRPGDYVLSRDEFDPCGALRCKEVLNVFRRTARIWEIGVRGRTIGTTNEHPFFVLGKMDFVPTWELRVGEVFLSDDGQWVRVEKVHDTGRYECVYNLRIADFHTYFVGGADWGFSVWAHNPPECQGEPNGQGDTKNPLPGQPGFIGPLTQSQAHAGINPATGSGSYSSFKNTNGSAGSGFAWHHIVEQTPNAGNFPAGALQNQGNIIPLPHGAGTVHSQISGYYSSIRGFTGGQTVRQWLNGQSFNAQFEFGIQVINELGGAQFLPSQLR